MPYVIPGYHFDPSRGKYFKIVADHAATASSSYSTSAVAQEEQKKKDREKLEEFSNRVQASRVSRNSLLQLHPLGGNLTLQRELGGHEGRTASATAAIWAKGLGARPFFGRSGLSEYREPRRRILHVIRDPGTHAIIYTMDWSEYGGHSNAPSVVVENPARAINDVNRYFVDHGKSLGIMPESEISSMTISPSRCVLATTLGGRNRTPTLHMILLVEPSQYFSSLSDIYRHRRDRNWDPGSACLPVIDGDVACFIQLRGTNTIWCSAAGPHPNAPVFAVGTSRGVRLFECRDLASPECLAFQNWPCNDPSQGRDDTLAIDFWTEHAVLAGMRSGKVRLWDIRANGTNVRFQHTSCVRQVRAIDEHKVLVAGLKNSLSMYDARFIKVSPQSQQSSTFTPSEPLYTFPTYRLDASIYPKHGFDVYKNLVASATEGSAVQIFDLTSGKELDIGNGFEHNLPNNMLSAPAMCLNFVENDRNGDGLRLLVANGKSIDAWMW